MIALLALLWFVSPAHAQSQGTLTAIASHLRSHDLAGAIATIDALPESERTPLVRYARGRAQFAAGDLADAATSLANLRDLPPELLLDARMRYATALARTGHCDRARPIFAELATPIARARGAECALIAGDLEAAEAELGAVVRDDANEVDLFAVRLELAEARALRRDAEGAARELRALIVERPEHPEIEVARARLIALIDEIELTAEENMNLAERLLDQKLAAAAVEALDDVRVRDRDDRWFHLRGAALFATRHAYPEAARVLSQSARRRSRWSIDDEMQAARARSRAGDSRAAIRAYRAFARAHRAHHDAPEAEYLAAWLGLRAKNRRAEREMSDFVRTHDVRGASREARDLVRDAKFELGLFSFEARRYAEAAARFEAYAREDEGAMVRARGLYWAGRAHLLARDRRTAITRFRDAIAVEPLHWYACLAAERLRELHESPGDPFPRAELRPAPAPLPPIALPPASRAFASIGLDRDAIEIVHDHERDIREAAPDGRELEALVAAYTALGATSRAYRLVARSDELDRRPDGQNRWLHDAAYPRPYRADVEAAAAAQSVPPELLYAIMRQESAYDPEAVSYADAIGLIQLIPPTAERVARSAGITLHREMLFDPRMNVQLGARYLGTLIRGLDDASDGDRAWPLAIAGYNAGGHRVREWLEARGETELDLFVERIPYDQTRNYVRRVTTHLAHYLYLRDPEAGFPLELPSTVAP